MHHASRRTEGGGWDEPYGLNDVLFLLLFLSFSFVCLFQTSQSLKQYQLICLVDHMLLNPIRVIIMLEV